jgi:hypothetical protein
VDGDSALTVETDGQVTFNGAVGSSMPLLSLTTAGQSNATLGAAQVNGGSVTTSGPQTFEGNVLLGSAASTTFTSTGGTALGAITFDGKVDGDSALTVETDGQVTFNGAVGSSTPLVSLTTEGQSNAALGATQINGGSVTTSGGETYDNALSTGSAATTTFTAVGAIDFASTVALGGTNTVVTSTGTGAAGAVTFAKTLTGASNLSVNTPGKSSFDGLVDVTSLTTDIPGATGSTAVNGGMVTTSNFQTYNDAVTMGAASTSFTAGGAITFASTLDGASVTTTTSVGSTKFVDAVGGTTALTSLKARVKGSGSNIIDQNNITATNGITLVTEGTTGIISFNPPQYASIALSAPSGSVQFIQRHVLNTQLATIVFEMQGLSPTSNLQFTNPTPTVSNPNAGTNDGLTITGERVTFNNPGEKLSVIGHVKIVAAGTSAHPSNAGTTVKLGDISALGRITVDSGGSGANGQTGPFVGAINLDLRPKASPNVDPNDPLSTGVDYVGTRIIFNSATLQTVNNFVFNNHEGTEPQFALPYISGNISNNILTGPFDVRQYPSNLSPLTVASFFQDQSNMAISSNGQIVDLNAQGTSDTNPAPTIAGAVPRDLIVPPTGDSAFDVNINGFENGFSIPLREVTNDELLEFLSGIPIYDDTQYSGTVITDRRLDAVSTNAVIDDYNGIFIKKGPDNVKQLLAPNIKTVLTAAFSDYNASLNGAAPEFNASSFAAFVASQPKDAEAAADLRQLNGLFVHLQLLGLNPGEYENAKKAVLTPITPDNVKPADLYQAILAVGQ